MCRARLSTNLLGGGESVSDKVTFGAINALAADFFGRCRYNAPTQRFSNGRRMRAKQRLLAVLFLAMAGTQAPAQAMDFLWDDWSGWPYGFSATLSRQKIDVDVAKHPSELNLTRVGLEFVDLTSKWVQGAMFAGRVVGNQDGFAPTQSVDMDGYYGGITLRRMIVDHSIIAIGLEARYTYQAFKDNLVPHQIEILTHQGDVALGARVSLGRRIGLYGGGSELYVTGTERIPGSAALDVGGKWTSVGFAGLDLLIEDKGHVGVEAKKGAIDGFEVYFQHRY